MVWHSTPETFRGERVPQLVHDLDDRQRHPVAKHPFSEKVSTSKAENCSSPDTLRTRRRPAPARSGAGRPGVKDLDARQQTLQPAIRPDQRQAEEQVMVQQPVPQTRFLLAKARSQLRRTTDVLGDDQLIFGQKACTACSSSGPTCSVLSVSIAARIAAESASDQ